MAGPGRPPGRGAADGARRWPPSPVSCPGPRVLALRDEVAVLAAQLRAPAERALEQQLASGQPLELVEAMARRLLDAHADSAVAARVLRTVGERRQAERLAVLVARAETETDAGRFGAAATLYREALALGAPVAEALQQASARAEADRRRTRIDAVAARLSEPDEAALLAWLALELPERALVETPCAEVVWLHQLDAPATGAGAKEAVRAVRALAQARPLMAEAPATALALVEPHRARLAGLPDADRLLALADEAIHLGRAARQRASLDAASALLRAGDVAAASQRLEGISADGLADEERDQLARLRRLAELRTALDATATPLERRPLLAELVELDSSFVSELSRLDAENERALRRVVFEGVEAPPAVLFAHGTRADARVWLTPAGDAAVLPDLRGPWLFLRWVSPATDRVQRAVRWRLPRASRLLDFVVGADDLRLLTEDRRVMRFSADGLTLLRMDALPGPPVEAGVLVPGSDHAWLADPEGVEVFAVSRRVRLRRLELGRLASLGTVGDAVVVRTQTTALHAASGPRLADLGPVEGVVTGIDGRPVPLSAEPTEAEGITTHGLRVGLAAGRRDGACFQLRLTHLWAGDLDWSLNVPADAELLRDVGGRHVAVAVPDPAGLQLRLLGLGAPPALALAAVTRPGAEIQPWRVRFERFPVARLPAVGAAREALRTVPVVSWLVEARAREGAWADALCYEVLRRVDAEAARMVVDAARRAWPRSGLVGLLEAEPAAEAGRWARARAALEGRTPEPEVALRFYHLLGFARLHTGGAPAALAAWQDGVAQVPDEAEELDGLIAAVAPALADGRPLDAPSVYAACMRALRQAELQRCAGDLSGVVEALDHPWTWHFGELQSLARLAEALLELPVPTPADALRRHHALAVFVDAAEGRLDLGPERRIALPLAAERWSSARIEAVAERTRRWLATA
ncbi:MAG: hypothetical protein R3F43_07095 [bacterium]